MPIRAATRRAAIGNLGAFGLLSVSAAGRALADPAVRFREIRVDVSPLRASAGDPTADWVEQALPEDLSRTLVRLFGAGSAQRRNLGGADSGRHFWPERRPRRRERRIPGLNSGHPDCGRTARRNRRPDAHAGDRRVLGQRRRSGLDRGGLPQSRCRALAGVRRPGAGRARSLIPGFGARHPIAFGAAVL